MTEYSVSPRGEDPQKDEKAVWKPKLECLRSLLWPAAFFFFFLSFFPPTQTTTVRDLDQGVLKSHKPYLRVCSGIKKG